jgi:hypothetical protein
MRVGIYAPDAGGHRLVYARLLVDAVHERGEVPVLLTLQDVPSSIEFHTHFSGVSVELYVLPERPRALWDLGVRAQSMSLGSLIVPEGDGFVVNMVRRTWRFAVNLTVLVNRDPMLGPWAPPSKEVIRRLVKAAALAVLRRRRGARVVVLGSPMAVSDIRSVPDPVILDASVESTVSAGQALRSTFPGPAAYYVGLLGGISERKCPVVVMEAVARASEFVGPLGLAMIGPGSGEWVTEEPAMRERLERAGVAYWREDRVLTNGEMNQAVAAVDAVMLAYTTHVPNSTAAKARALGTRVLGAGSGDFCRYIESCGGSTVTSLTPGALSNLIIGAFDRPRPEPEGDDSLERFLNAMLA